MSLIGYQHSTMYVYLYMDYRPSNSEAQILNIWKMLNLSIWLVNPFLIWPMKSAYSEIQGFDWVLISCVVCLIQIFRLCTLRVWCFFYLSSDWVQGQVNFFCYQATMEIWSKGMCFMNNHFFVSFLIFFFNFRFLSKLIFIWKEAARA